MMEQGPTIYIYINRVCSLPPAPPPLSLPGLVGVSSDMTILTTRVAVEDGRLFRCLICSSLTIVPPDWLRPQGQLYEKAGMDCQLADGVEVLFPFDKVKMARYDGKRDRLVPLNVDCFSCSSHTRLVSGDGTVQYRNGDRTQTPSDGNRCGCGYKHYWDGKEYDNLPEK